MRRRLYAPYSVSGSRPGSRVTGADSSARPARVTRYERSATIEPMTTADVLDAAPPELTPERRRGDCPRHLRPDRECRSAGQRARPELPPHRSGGRRMGPEGLERRRGPRRGRDGGGRGRAHRRGRPRAARAGGRPGARWLDSLIGGDRQRRSTSSAFCRSCPAATPCPGSSTSTPSRASVRSSAASAMPFAASSIPRPVGPSCGISSAYRCCSGTPR